MDSKRLQKAIENTKRLPDGWTIQIWIENDSVLTFLNDPFHEDIDRYQVYDDFAELPEQIENSIAYAIANNGDYQ